MKVTPIMNSSCVISYWSSIVPVAVSCTLYEITFDRSTVVLFDTPLAFNAPDGGVPLGRSPQNFARTEVRGWLRYTAAKKYCRKLQPLSRVHERYRQTNDIQTTDGFAIAKTPT